jgi:hypothetical protein
MIPPHALFWRTSPRERLVRWRKFLRDLEQSAISGADLAYQIRSQTREA